MFKRLHRAFMSSALTSQSRPNHAVVSTFDLFSIGIGPSSSHTVGPMRAARLFVEDISSIADQIRRLHVDLYGSLALTGVGHGTPNACLMGLEGESPESVVAESIPSRCEEIARDGILRIGGRHTIQFDSKKHLRLHMQQSLPNHPNGMRFSAFDGEGDLLATNEYYSIGGGFVINGKTEFRENVYYKDRRVDHKLPVKALSKPYDDFPDDDRLPAEQEHSITPAIPFTNADDLLQLCEAENLTIAQIVYKNELQWRSSQEIKSRLLGIWEVMDQSIYNGVQASSDLPGDLKVRRRAPNLYKRLAQSYYEWAGMNSVGADKVELYSIGGLNSVKRVEGQDDILLQKRRHDGRKKRLPALDWLTLYAIAVNEENAAGGRVVTAPTNGAAGIIPSVIKYYLNFIDPHPVADHSHDHAVIEYLLTCSAIGMLYKRGASISAAEMGCQGEVGVACSMAAAGLTAIMGGTANQIEAAAEIGMEHNLGLTCDPVGGLVQIPCIERNALGAVKAVTAAQLALSEDGIHRVSLDQVIQTMKQTGHDMTSKYKETSLVGFEFKICI